MFIRYPMMGLQPWVNYLRCGIRSRMVIGWMAGNNCTICKDRGRDVKAATGVTIPCKKSTCSAHVHVSCAQSKRLLKFAFKDDMVCLTYCARHGGNRSRSSSAQTNTHSTHSTTKGGGAQVGRSTSASANEESGKEGDRDINRQRSKQREGESSRASRAVSQTKEGEERPAATNAGSFKSKNSKSGDSAGGIKRELKGSITNTSGEREGSTREGDRDTTEQDRNSKRPRKDVKRESSVRETKGTSTSSIAISKDASGSQLRARVQSFVRSQNTEMKEFIEQAMLGTKEKFVEILPKVRQMSEDNRALQLRIKALEDEHAALTTVQQRLNERRQAKTVPPKADNMQHVNKNLITAIFIILSELNGQSMESFNAIENKDSFILKVFDQLQAQAEEGVSPTARDRLIRGVLSKCLKEFTLI
ncbi:hypothetical protein SARC_04582 [Sphaeroforma arctica JP610]|uniref:PHD-type domain-containing protein n=1 Tax=Sphaeroforma arctica JP610 TaxID=667725 RepID=A0A0L0G4K4_9EUKA|nr:hypothetical protein SARC_04582 [Sphaeroforma arctica JP610]KNC83153.1 hypothetical protein SARC_04582 [Sphaeroforma arctica JP610]|eukprot:XP_014157055.1 hypothetical protein SARC_04582 [Sphaeroforma arctica JP610]